LSDPRSVRAGVRHGEIPPLPLLTLVVEGAPDEAVAFDLQQVPGGLGRKKEGREGDVQGIN
jgi:hypothetical protein